MSGRKRIYVDEAKWHELQRDANKLAELRRDVPTLIERVRDQARADVQRAFTELDQRQAGVEQSMNRLSDRAKKFEEATARQVRQSAEKLRRSLDSQIRAERGHTAALLNEQRQALRQEIDQERQERRRRMDELGQSIGALEKDRQAAAALAVEYLDDALALRDAVLLLPHERYQPGAVDALQRRLATAESNRRMGLDAFGLSGAQQLYHDLSDLKLELEQHDLEWRASRSAAHQAMLVVQELVRQNERLELFDADGRRVSGDAPDVDHWSRGALRRLRDEIVALIARIEDDTNPMTTEELRTVVETTQADLEQRLDTVVRQAGAAIYASQLRTNFADMIARALERHHHYEVVDACFSGEDQRESFYAKTTNELSKSEIVIEVAPVADDRPECEVRIHSFDADQASEEERHARMDSVAASLRQQGITVASTEEEDSEPDPAAHDLAQVRRRTPERQQAAARQAM